MSLRSQLAFVCSLAHTAVKDDEGHMAVAEAHAELGRLVLALEQEIAKQTEEKRKADEAAAAEEKKKQK